MALLNPPHAAGGPTVLGVPLKQASLITLTFQNSALILIMHYSRIMSPPGDHRYFASTAVFLNEVMKLAICLTFSIYEVSRSLAPQTPATVMFEQIYNSVFSGDGWKLAIPGFLYTFENTLQYVALSNLDAVHFQILYQLKIITTAFFSVVLLGRMLGIRRWMSLVVLTLGVSIVSLPTSNANDLAMDIHDFSDHFFPRSMHELGQVAGEVARHLTRRGVENLDGLAGALTRRSATYEGIKDDLDTGLKMNYSLGVTAVLVSAVVSGLTGVYFEKVLKDTASSVSVWTRNIQLSFYSLIAALFVGVIFNDGGEIAKHGFFDGYNGIVWAAVVFQAVGGVLTSLCINYADNIAKNFATSISIVISFVFSVFFFDFIVTFPFLLGTGLVLASTYMYSMPERKRGRPPPINIVGFEKTMVDGTPRIVDQEKLSVNPMDSLGAGLSTSRPSTPLPRSHSSRGKKSDD
ncbi:putative nucleotide-sugar transporter [Podospora aff. communis PSN243]|uniref:Nucleotide-sugar transporter n=1 Tax=Podospora aff. communis PSN243 TaxID=3040156 RepID=A0AAV9G3V0_9PEZI|nr:putative nucleotide-sugar transporter [Podospora aff. communis PSN243]